MAQERFYGQSSMPDVVAQWRAYFAMLDLRPGHRVLDVGCHEGDAIALLLDEHPDVGRVVGLDRNEQKSESARRRFAGDPRVEIVTADAVAPPLPDSGFDRIYTADTLEWVSAPSTALSEMRRMLADGGFALVVHTDFDTQVFAADELEPTRRLVHAFADGGRHGTIGRELFGLCTGAGFARVDASVWTFVGTSFAPALYPRKMVGMMRRWLVDEGNVEAADFNRWVNGLATRDRDGRFFYSVNRNICLCAG